VPPLRIRARTKFHVLPDRRAVRYRTCRPEQYIFEGLRSQRQSFSPPGARSRSRAHDRVWSLASPRRLRSQRRRSCEPGPRAPRREGLTRPTRKPSCDASKTGHSRLRRRSSNRGTPPRARTRQASAQAGARIPMRWLPSTLWVLRELVARADEGNRLDPQGNSCPALSDRGAQ
jgi:hypothetical protein